MWGRAEVSVVNLLLCLRKSPGFTWSSVSIGIVLTDWEHAPVGLKKNTEEGEFPCSASHAKDTPSFLFSLVSCHSAPGLTNVIQNCISNQVELSACQELHFPYVSEPFDNLNSCDHI